MTRDGSAFARLYRGELDGLVRLAHVSSGDRSAAEEIVAEAVARVWARWRRHDIDDLTSYLRRAVVNEVIARSRRRARFESRRPLLLVDAAIARSEAAVDDRDALWIALRALPVEQRAAIALRYLTDLTEAQTAETLGVPLGTVKSRVSRGLEQLRAQLSEGHEHA